MGGMNLVSHSAARRETPHEPLCLDPTQVQTALEPSLIAGEPAARSLEVPPAAISPFPVALEPTQLQIIEASTQPKELPEFLEAPKGDLDPKKPELQMEHLDPNADRNNSIRMDAASVTADEVTQMCSMRGDIAQALQLMEKWQHDMADGRESMSGACCLAGLRLQVLTQLVLTAYEILDGSDHLKRDAETISRWHWVMAKALYLPHSSAIGEVSQEQNDCGGATLPTFDDYSFKPDKGAHQKPDAGEDFDILNVYDSELDAYICSNDEVERRDTAFQAQFPAYDANPVDVAAVNEHSHVQFDGPDVLDVGQTHPEVPFLPQNAPQSPRHERNAFGSVDFVPDSAIAVLPPKNGAAADAGEDVGIPKRRVEDSIPATEVEGHNAGWFAGGWAAANLPRAPDHTAEMEQMQQSHVLRKGLGDHSKISPATSGAKSSVLSLGGQEMIMATEAEARHVASFVPDTQQDAFTCSVRPPVDPSSHCPASRDGPALNEAGNDPSQKPDEARIAAALGAAALFAANLGGSQTVTEDCPRLHALPMPPKIAKGVRPEDDCAPGKAVVPAETMIGQLEGIRRSLRGKAEQRNEFVGKVMNSRARGVARPDLPGAAQPILAKRSVPALRPNGAPVSVKVAAQKPGGTLGHGRNTRRVGSAKMALSGLDDAAECVEEREDQGTNGVLSSSAAPSDPRQMNLRNPRSPAAKNSMLHVSVAPKKTVAASRTGHSGGPLTHPVAEGVVQESLDDPYRFSIGAAPVPEEGKNRGPPSHTEMPPPRSKKPRCVQINAGRTSDGPQIRRTSPRKQHVVLDFPPQQVVAEAEPKEAMAPPTGYLTRRKKEVKDGLEITYLPYPIIQTAPEYGKMASPSRDGGVVAGPVKAIDVVVGAVIDGRKRRRSSATSKDTPNALVSGTEPTTKRNAMTASTRGQSKSLVVIREEKSEDQTLADYVLRKRQKVQSRDKKEGSTIAGDPRIHTAGKEKQGNARKSSKRNRGKNELHESLIDMKNGNKGPVPAAGVPIIVEAQPKSATRRRSSSVGVASQLLKGMAFLISLSGNGTEDGDAEHKKESVKELVESMGGRVVDQVPTPPPVSGSPHKRLIGTRRIPNESPITAIISDGVYRRPKCIYAGIYGLPIVSPGWLADSKKANRLPPWDEADVRPPINPRPPLAFDGLRVHLHAPKPGLKRELEALLRHAGAVLVPLPDDGGSLQEPQCDLIIIDDELDMVQQRKLQRHARYLRLDSRLRSWAIDTILQPEKLKGIPGMRKCHAPGLTNSVQDVNALPPVGLMNLDRTDDDPLINMIDRGGHVPEAPRNLGEEPQESISQRVVGPLILAPPVAGVRTDVVSPRPLVWAWEGAASQPPAGTPVNPARRYHNAIELGGRMRIAVGMYVQLAPGPGEDVNRVAEVVALWSERVGLEERPFGRFLRFYRPEETPFALSYGAGSTTNQLFKSKHIDDRVPLAAVVRPCLVTFPTSAQQLVLPSASVARGAPVPEYTCMCEFDHEAGSLVVLPSQL